MTPGLEAKPIESVENACATGGQAILAVASKLMLGEGDVGLAVGIANGAAVRDLPVVVRCSRLT